MRGPSVGLLWSSEKMADVRVWSVDNDISAVIAASGVPVAEWSGSDGATWVDPMVGVKARFDTYTPWFFNAWGMIGTGSSDISENVLAGAGYQWTDKFSTVAGYHALGVDYTDDGFSTISSSKAPISVRLFISKA